MLVMRMTYKFEDMGWRFLFTVMGICIMILVCGVVYLITLIPQYPKEAAIIAIFLAVSYAIGDIIRRMI
jgi:hypothetical protein